MSADTESMLVKVAVMVVKFIVCYGIVKQPRQLHGELKICAV